MILSNDFLSITAASAEKYLVNIGWNKDFSFKNKKLLVFRQNERMLALPSSEKYNDFYDSLANIISALSQYSNNPIESIINEILMTNNDKLKFRIVSKFSQDGKLPLKYASKCIDGLKELVLYSACAVQQAKPICLRASKSAMKYLDSFKLAQTEVGSFIFNVDIKVVDEGFDEIALDKNIIEPPIEHKIVQRINTAINQIDSIVNKKYIISEIIENAFEDGITANMCDALLKLQPENEDIEIYTNFYYASSMPDDETPKSTKLENMHFYVIEDIANRYRDKTLIEEVELYGKVMIVKTLEGELIHLVTEIEGNERTIIVPLSREHFLLACDAIKASKTVRITGELDKSNRTWSMNEVWEFGLTD